MKVWLTLSDGSQHAVKTIDGASFAEVSGMNCSCGKELRIYGKGSYIESHDTYAATAVCLYCRSEIGIVRAVVNTIFGLEEDEAVLKHGRARVY